MLMFPNQTFFKPSQVFLHNLSKMVGAEDKIVEVGSGSGECLSMIQSHGMLSGNVSMETAVGYDLILRQSYYTHVNTLVDATQTLGIYPVGCTILVCRPDHSGWVYDLMGMILKGDIKPKRFIYVGLPTNFEIDIHDVLLGLNTIEIGGVGEEGEVMLVWEFGGLEVE